MAELQTVVTAFLLSAGTLGKKEQEIFRRFKAIPKEEVLRVLENLWREKKVQRFTLGKIQVWRATEALNT